MKNLLFGFVLLSFLFVSCNNNLVFDQTKEVNVKGWNKSDIVEFEVEIKDTLRLYDFAINLRNTVDYPKSNIYFFIKTIYPDGSVTRCDTVECYLAYPDGTWTGKGSGSIKDNRFWFTKNVIFPLKGKYKFEIEQATRDTSIVGIKNIGLHIEYRKTK
ncbi:MAG: gliding motility-associated lipoprotein GldH [Bacteroidetes bacterium]|nr:gliding motility-associated lipoprotein GldH [Bacteroidota bacterium]